MAEVGVVGAMLLVPLFIGGRHPWGHFVLVLCALAAALGWVLQTWRFGDVRLIKSNAEWLLGAAAILVALQLVPLPHDILRVLSPKSQEVLFLWQGKAENRFLGRWSFISLTPGETLYSVCFFGSYVVLLWVTLQILERKDDVYRILQWVGVAGVVIAVIGVVQYVSGTEKFVGIYEHPFRKASEYLTGTFSTKNHFGHYLVLALGPLLFLVLDEGDRANGARSSLARGDKARLPVRFFWIVALALVVAAIVGSLSRGAVVAALAAVCVFLWAALRSRRIHFSWFLGAVLACAVASVVVWGAEGARVKQRIGSLTSGSLDQLDPRGARRLIWSTVLAGIPDFAPLGSGIGSLREVYPSYLVRHDIPRYFTHAESGYLQVTLEAGFPGLMLLLVGIITVAGWIRRGILSKGDPKVVLASGAVGGSLAASILHSFFDFVWYVPGSMTVTVVLAACACRLSQLSWNQPPVGSATTSGPLPQGELPLKRGSWIRLICFAGIVSAFGIWAGFWTFRAGLAASYWDAYLLADRHSRAWGGRDVTAETRGEYGEGEAKLSSESGDDVAGIGAAPEHEMLVDAGGETVRSEVPLDYSAIGAAGSDKLNRTSAQSSTRNRDGSQYSALESQEQAVQLLEKVVFYFPVHARAHLALASSYLRLFELLQMKSENALPLSQIRQAAISAPFSSEEERRAWLDRVLGSRMMYLDEAKSHALAALKLCPLLGEAYLVLASLDFLWYGGGPSADALVAQALKVRPTDGAVLFYAGQMAMLRGDFEEGLVLWQKAFRCGIVYQQRILRLLVGRVDLENPAQELRFFLEAFDPELPALQLLHQQFQERLGDEEIQPLRERIAQDAIREAESLPPAQAAERWLLAAKMYAKMGKHDLQLEASEKAFQCDPSSYRVRYFLAEALMAAGNYVEAEKHYQWCLYRKPGNETLEGKLRWVRQRQLEEQSRKVGET
jgi:tetratricopeptide (TPR) repeat protein/O-antigen ligase